MTDFQFFYRKDTLQIDAVFIDCKTGSALFKDPSVYAEVNVVDPPHPVTRNHRVVLGPGRRVVGTEHSLNPLQPTPAPLTVPATMRIPDYGKDIEKLRKRIEELEKRKPVIKEVVKEVPVPAAPAAAPPEQKKPWYKFW